MERINITELINKVHDRNSVNHPRGEARCQCSQPAELCDHLTRYTSSSDQCINCGHLVVCHLPSDCVTKASDYLEWMLLALTNDKMPIVLDVHVTINDKEVEAQAKKITAKVVRDAKAKLREVVDPLTAVVKNVLRDQEA